MNEKKKEKEENSSRTWCLQSCGHVTCYTKHSPERGNSVLSVHYRKQAHMSSSFPKGTQQSRERPNCIQFPSITHQPGVYRFSSLHFPLKHDGNSVCDFSYSIYSYFLKTMLWRSKSIMNTSELQNLLDFSSCGCLKASSLLIYI